ncbi:MAG: Antitoxin Phd YefM, type toxin-antitoxin system [Actinomycetota bacterium]|jgi:prevent-host-death family protein|nr:Antitoxin Phd YefM, type toxin-antitoxin system [Actinomycetota bacterium]
MKAAHRLPTVSVRDLVRNPAQVLERVERGERFIVCRHRRPVATLQPIDGWVGDIDGRKPCDIYGFPIGDPEAEASKLSDLQKHLLVNVRLGRFIFSGEGYQEAIDDLTLRGMARKSSHRGMVITGRGIVLSEWLKLRTKSG